MPKLSICIPFHQSPSSAFFLSRVLKSISEQTFKDYEIILTSDGLMARNHNTAIRQAKGEIIQFIGMDDYLEHPNALQEIVDGFDDILYRTEHGYDTVWQISGCLHDVNGDVGYPHTPKWTDDIYTGNNQLGGLSVLSFRKDTNLLFEEPLQWMIDVDFYYRMYLKYGLPKFLLKPAVVVDTHQNSTTNSLSKELKNNEVQYLLKKYGK